MSKQFKKERIGAMQGSVGPTKAGDLIHSPEELQRFQQMFEMLQPRIAASIEQNVDAYLDLSADTYIDNLITYIINIINSYLDTVRIIGLLLQAGRGIKIKGGRFIEVDFTEDKGLKFSKAGNTAKLECEDGDGIAFDSNGIKIDLDTSLDTTGTGSGLSLSAADGSGKLRVAPEDFLYMGA